MKDGIEKYLRNARECRDRAKTSLLASEREKWLKLAEDWEELAGQVASRQDRYAGRN
jgi:hypothetical protein